MDRLEYTAKTMSYPERALNSFSAEFISEAACNSWFTSLAYPAGPHCPCCKKKITDDSTLKNFSAFNRCACKSCNHWFTAKTGTILQDSKITVTEFYLLCLLFGWKIPTAAISRILKISQSTVNLWQRKIKLLTEEKQ